MRTPIGIAMDPRLPDSAGRVPPVAIYVLCDDGSVFTHLSDGDGWIAIDPVPGTEAAAATG